MSREKDFQFEYSWWKSDLEFIRRPKPIMSVPRKKFITKDRLNYNLLKAYKIWWQVYKKTGTETAFENYLEARKFYCHRNKIEKISNFYLRLKKMEGKNGKN